MNFFSYHKNELYAENVAVKKISQDFGTPCYIYSKAAISANWQAFNVALSQQPHHIHFAVKACSNIALLHLLAQLGSGFDVVSCGELYRVLKAGGKAENTVFSGVGKTENDIAYALRNNIACLNVESEPELLRIQNIAAHLNLQAPVALRINPDIDAKTHPYISTGLKENKFGIEYQKAYGLYLNQHHFPNINFIGIACHIGSQIVEPSPFLLALDKVLTLYDALKEKGLQLSHINLGGGLGVCYKDEHPPTPSALIQRLKERLLDRQVALLLEPGRAIVANAGILISQVEYIKIHHQKHFAIIDAAMNDFLRPALYEAYQKIDVIDKNKQGTTAFYDLVGPVCESADFLGKHRLLTLSAKQIIAIFGAGAYGYSMSSNYNSRPRPPEILVDNRNYHLIRQRETLEDLIKHEVIVS